MVYLQREKGLASLPFFDAVPLDGFKVSLADIDLCLVTHFHRDHAEAVPYLCQHTPFVGPVFMTGVTKEVCEEMWRDTLHNMSRDEHAEDVCLFNEEDIGRTVIQCHDIEFGRLYDHEEIMARVRNERIRLLQADNPDWTLEMVEEEVEAGMSASQCRVSFRAYPAGHVIGAAMFEIMLDDVRIFFTGDYNSETDGHLIAAQVPSHLDRIGPAGEWYPESVVPSRMLTAGGRTSADGAEASSGGEREKGGDGAGVDDEDGVPDAETTQSVVRMAVPKRSTKDVLASQKVHLFICESTHGKERHGSVEKRVNYVFEKITDVMDRGGVALLPAFTTGPTTGLMFLLHDLWNKIFGAAAIPRSLLDQNDHKMVGRDRVAPTVYCYSRLARSIVEKTLVKWSSLLDTRARHIVQTQWQDRFVFEHDRRGEVEKPCVIIAAPGTLDDGMSLDIFSRLIAPNPKNAVVITGYPPRNSLVYHLKHRDWKEAYATLKRAQERTGRSIPWRDGDKPACDIFYESFSAHADYSTTSDFVRRMEPEAVALFHGVERHVRELKSELKRDFRYLRKSIRALVNGETAKFGVSSRTALAVGDVLFPDRLDEGHDDYDSMDADNEHDEENGCHGEGEDGAHAEGPASDLDVVGGSAGRVQCLLVRTSRKVPRLISVDQLNKFTDIRVARVRQTVRVPFAARFTLAEYYIRQLFADVFRISRTGYQDQTLEGSDGTPLVTSGTFFLRVCSSVDVHALNSGDVAVSWVSSSMSDTIADSILCILMRSLCSPGLAMSTALPCRGCSHTQCSDGSSEDKVAVKKQKKDKRDASSEQMSGIVMLLGDYAVVNDVQRRALAPNEAASCVARGDGTTEVCTGRVCIDLSSIPVPNYAKDGMRKRKASLNENGRADCDTVATPTQERIAARLRGDDVLRDVCMASHPVSSDSMAEADEEGRSSSCPRASVVIWLNEITLANGDDRVTILRYSKTVAKDLDDGAALLPLTEREALLDERAALLYRISRVMQVIMSAVERVAIVSDEVTEKDGDSTRLYR